MEAERVALVGFGEAAQAFAPGIPATLRAYDRKWHDPHERSVKQAEAEAAGVSLVGSTAEAVGDSFVVLSLVTAGEAPLAARETAAALAPGALFLDMNSVAPVTKRRNAEFIWASGGRYVDVAIMSPVLPGRRSVPLLVAGEHADAGAAALTRLGFANARVVAGPVGTASAIKMVRSVVVKGLEALTTECLLAAHAAGVMDEVVASLDASWPGADWAARGDYNLERMIVHGERRADEMDEVVRTLDALGISSAMSRATASRQRMIGGLRIPASDGLGRKLAAVRQSLSRPETESPYDPDH